MTAFEALRAFVFFCAGIGFLIAGGLICLAIIADDQTNQPFE